MDVIPQVAREMDRISIRTVVALGGCLLSGAILAIALAPAGAWPWWGLSIPILLGSALLWWSRTGVLMLSRRLLQESRNLAGRLEDAAGQLRAERQKRLLLENLSAVKEREWEATRIDLEKSIEAARSSEADARREYETLKFQLSRLSDEYQQLERRESETHQRRLVLEGQYRDLEASARELGEAHTQRADRHVQSMEEVRILREKLDGASRELAALRAELDLLRLDKDKLHMEKQNLEIRATRLEASVGEWKERALTAQEESRRQQVNRPLEEELQARQREIERLAAELENQREQRGLDVLRRKKTVALESDLRGEAARLAGSLRQAEELIAQLERTVHADRLESRESMIDHFLWKVNYFRESELILNFVNGGIGMDIIDVSADSPLIADRPSPISVRRGAEGRIRVTSGAALPSEFLVRCRFTIHPQEAVFRIRPSGPVKLERMFD